MCKKCGDIDKEIEWLEQLADPGLDSLNRALMRADLEFLNAEKTSLHCKGIIDVAAPPLCPETY
jgi:hypothetical protein